MSGIKRWVLLGAELLLWVGFGVFAYLSIGCLNTARIAPALWDYLAPERLEERQFKWFLTGVLYAIPALGTLAGAVCLEIHRRKKKGGRE